MRASTLQGFTVHKHNGFRTEQSVCNIVDGCFSGVPCYYTRMYPSCSCSKCGVSRGCQGARVPQFSAHYVGVLHCPVVLTDSSPCAVIEDLHSSLAGCISTNKTNHWFRSCSVYMWTCLCTYMSMCACVHVCMCACVGMCLCLTVAMKM